MKTNKITKSFDAVKMMRDSRTLISKETKDMNLEQLNNYIQEKLAKSNSPKIGTKKTSN